MMRLLLLSAILIFLISHNIQSQDSVSVTFQVVVPEETPADDVIFWAGTLNRWNPGNGLFPKTKEKPLDSNKDLWEITLSAEKGSSVDYKYTRGSIFSVEEQADWTFKNYRTVVLDESKTVQDTVSAWHDIPPEALQDRWPKVDLVSSQRTVTYNGSPMEGMGTVLPDKERAALYYDIETLHTDVAGIPESVLENYVTYFLKVSEAPDNTILVLAGKTKDNNPWNIYADQDNNNRITPEEMIFVIDSVNAGNSWTGYVHTQKYSNNTLVSDSLKLTLRTVENMPARYTSSKIPGAPDLSYQIPFRQRKGNLEGNDFFVVTTANTKFSKYFYLYIDENNDGNLEMASGSSEATIFQLNQMIRLKKYYMHPTFQLGEDQWEVANIEEDGDWIRLRPAFDFNKREQITIGSAIPDWEAVTVEGDTLSSDSIKGKYLLMDFWGSWCGPCIEALPLLKEVYQHFQSENFEMVGFAYESRASLDKALEKYSLPWPQVLDDKGTYKTRFLVQGYPTHYLIGPEGKVLAMGNELRGKKLIKTLEKYLDK